MFQQVGRELELCQNNSRLETVIDIILVTVKRTVIYQLYSLVDIDDFSFNKTIYDSSSTITRTHSGDDCFQKTLHGCCVDSLTLSVCRRLKAAVVLIATRTRSLFPEDTRYVFCWLLQEAFLQKTLNVCFVDCYKKTTWCFSRRLMMTVVLIATRKLPVDDSLQKAQFSCYVDCYKRTLRLWRFPEGSATWTDTVMMVMMRWWW
jgi:hypothetical protein